MSTSGKDCSHRFEHLSMAAGPTGAPFIECACGKQFTRVGAQIIVFFMAMKQEHDDKPKIILPGGG